MGSVLDTLTESERALTTAKHFVLDKLKLAAAMGACSTPALELGGARKGEVFSVGPRGNPTRNPTAPPRK